MNKSFVLTFAAFLTLGLTASVNAAPAHKAPDNVIVVNDAFSPVLVEVKSYRYVGNSTAMIYPNIGINGMHETCQTAFGSSARMCTTTEVFETPNLPLNNVIGQAAWVQPIISGTILSSTEVLYVVNGVLLPESLGGGISGMNCRTWSEATVNNRGAIIGTGAEHKISINYANCNEDLYVACCLPRQIKETDNNGQRVNYKRRKLE